MLRALISLILALLASMPAASGISEEEMRVSYLYNFALFTNWPEPIGDTFNFCLLGRAELGTTASILLDGKRIKGTPVRVARLTGLAKIHECHLLYVTEEAGKEVGLMAKKLAGRPVLTVVAMEAGIGDGIIQMGINSNRLVFDINEGLATDAHLSISSKLLKLARNVKAI